MCDRVFSDLYDSVEQRRFHGALDRRGLEEGYRGRIRLDTLLNRSLVLTDSQLLDGTLLLEMGPQTVGEMTGFRERSVVIRCRARTIEQSLIQMVYDHSARRYRGFLFSSLPDRPNLREHLAQDLASRQDIHPSDWREIPKVLNELGCPNEICDKQEREWGLWIEVATEQATSASPWLIIEEWPHNAMRQFGPMFRRFLGEEFPDIPDGETVPDELRALRDDPFRVFNRSRFDQECQNLRYQVLRNSQEEEALRTIESSVHRAYNAAIGAQHGCRVEYRDDDIDDSVRPRRLLRRCIGRVLDPNHEMIGEACEVPDRFVARLASLDTDQYCRWLSENREHLSQWWDTKYPPSLRRAIDSLDQLFGVSPSQVPVHLELMVHFSFETITRFVPGLNEALDPISEELLERLWADTVCLYVPAARRNMIIRRFVENVASRRSGE